MLILNSNYRCWPVENRTRGNTKNRGCFGHTRYNLYNKQFNFFMSRFNFFTFKAWAIQVWIQPSIDFLLFPWRYYDFGTWMYLEGWDVLLILSLSTSFTHLSDDLNLNSWNSFRNRNKERAYRLSRFLAWIYKQCQSVPTKNMHSWGEHEKMVPRCHQT